MVMMMKARFIRLLTLLFLATPITVYCQAQTGDSLTVDEAVRMAVSRNPELLRAEASVQASNARVEQTKTADLPSVRFDGSYTRIGPVPQLFFPGLGAFKLYPEDNYDAHVGVHQKIYDFGKSSTNTDVTQSRVAFAEHSVTLLKSTLSYQTIQLFYSILFLQQSIQVKNEDIKTLNEHLLVNKKRLEAGTGTDFEVLTTQVRVAASQNQKIDLENSLQKQEIGLRRLLGLPDSTPLNLRGEFHLAPTALDTDSLTSIALVQRTDYQQAQSEEQTAKLQYQLAEKSDMPILALNASYGIKNGFIPNLNVLRGNWVAGIDLEVPLYEGGNTGYKEEEAQANLRGSEAHVNDTKLQIAADVRQAISDVHAAEGKLDATSLEVQQAKDALSIAQRRFDAGTVSNLDVLDAETSLSQAHLLRLRALYQYVSSRYALEYAIGTPIWNQKGLE